MSRHANVPRRRERGAALAIVLVLLLVMTMLGLAGMRMSLLQERMNSSVYDRSLYFQAAEAALRRAEETAGDLADTAIPAAATCNTNGICGFPSPSAAPVWETKANWDSYGKAVTTSFGSQVPDQPKYLIELLANEVPVNITECSTYIDISATECGGTAKRYRVTSRIAGADGSERGQVMLQSIYIVP